MKHDWKQLLSYIKKYEWKIVWIKQFHDFLDAGIEWIDQNRNIMKESKEMRVCIKNYVYTNHKDYSEVPENQDYGYSLYNLRFLLNIYCMYGEQKFLLYMANRHKYIVIEKIKILKVKITLTHLKVYYGIEKENRIDIPLEKFKEWIFNGTCNEDLYWDFFKDCYVFGEMPEDYYMLCEDD